MAMTILENRAEGRVFSLAVCLSLAACGGGGSEPVDQSPIVSAGVDQSVIERASVSLAGTVSDDDGAPTVSWSQTSGPTVPLVGANTLTPRFSAPSIAQPAELTFRLTADDGVNPPVFDTVVVAVSDQGVFVTKLNPDGVSYIDPEIHPERPELVFQSAGVVWVGAFDPETGEFATGDGRDTFVDETLSLTISKNGPEYGLDSNGVAIFYNVEGNDGSPQFARATELGVGSYVVEALTPSDGVSRINQLASQDSDAFSTFLAYGSEPASGPPGAISYLDEEAPGEDLDATTLNPLTAGFRWLAGETVFATTIGEGADFGQIALVDAATQEIRVVTDDPGVKFDPYPWRAPEFDGAIAIHATVDETDLAIYVDRGGETFERVALLTPPDATDLQFVQSAEPFVSSQDVSYISLTLKDDPGSVFTDVENSEIWIYGIEDGADRFVLNCSDEAPVKVRHEAEMFSGVSEALVFYNEIDTSGLFDLVVCATGLPP